MKYISYLIILMGVFFASCNSTKLLKENELLVTESVINFPEKEKISNVKETQYALENLVKPSPNTGLFKFRLWTYLKLREHTKEKGFKSWIKRKIGQPPALYNAADIENSKLRIQQYLKNNGYLQSDLSLDTTVVDQKVKLKYNIATHGQYKIKEIFLPEDSSDIASIIYRASRRSYLKPGDPYQELLLGEERTRISEVANNRGFLKFDPNDIFYFVDTIPNTLELNIYVRVNENEKDKKQQIFRVGKTYAYPNFNLTNEDGIKAFKDTVSVASDFKVIQNGQIIRPAVLDRLILQNEGDIYNKRRQDFTVSHLLDLGVFKFVNIKYESVYDSTATDQVLNRLIYLTPGISKTLTTNLEVNNRTGSFFGTSASVNFNHKNLFDRALIWNTQLSAGVETQSGVAGPLINTLDFSFQTSLSLPRLFLFPNRKFMGAFVPRTNLTFSNNYQRRTDTYTVNTTSFSYGYSWKQNRRIKHTFNPFTIRQVNLLTSSADFDELLDENARLRSSFTDVFIGGMEYTFVYSSQANDSRDDYWYYRAKTQIAGNAFSLFLGKKSNGDPGEIFGQPYSQFISLEQDIRYYFPLLRKGKIAFRLNPSIGVAYGNSDLLPYVEQYFVGGANSLRAFQIRGVGPGSFFNSNASSSTIDQQFIDQTGDLKLEFNAEYRFPIFGYLKGALFLDAGNVWLLKEDLDTEGGQFKFDSFYKEIAVGAGFGVRFDAEFFVLRLDLAAPIHQPTQQDVFEWQPEHLNIFSNLNEYVWNIAIGYPF